MRIAIRIAVSREMLAAGEHTLLLQRSHEDERGSRHTLMALADARSPMTGLAGLLWMSSTGAKLKLTPSEASSMPIARPTAAA